MRFGRRWSPVRSTETGSPHFGSSRSGRKCSAESWARFPPSGSKTSRCDYAAVVGSGQRMIEFRAFGPISGGGAPSSAGRRGNRGCTGGGGGPRGGGRGVGRWGGGRGVGRAPWAGGESQGRGRGEAG